MIDRATADIQRERERAPQFYQRPTLATTTSQANLRGEREGGDVAICSNLNVPEPSVHFDFRVKGRASKTPILFLFL